MTKSIRVCLFETTLQSFGVLWCWLVIRNHVNSSEMHVSNIFIVCLSVDMLCLKLGWAQTIFAFPSNSPLSEGGSGMESTCNWQAIASIWHARLFCRFHYPIDVFGTKRTKEWALALLSLLCIVNLLLTVIMTSHIGINRIYVSFYSSKPRNVWFVRSVL